MDTKSVLIGAVAGCCLMGYFFNKDKKETVIHKTTVIEKEPMPSFQQHSREFYEDIEEVIPPVQTYRVKRQKLAPNPIIIQQPNVQYVPDVRFVNMDYYPRPKRYFCPPVRYFHTHDFPRDPKRFDPPPHIHHHRDFRPDFRDHHRHQRHW